MLPTLLIKLNPDDTPQRFQTKNEATGETGHYIKIRVEISGQEPLDMMVPISENISDSDLKTLLEKPENIYGFGLQAEHHLKTEGRWRTGEPRPTITLN